MPEELTSEVQKKQSESVKTEETSEEKQEQKKCLKFRRDSQSSQFYRKLYILKQKIQVIQRMCKIKTF